MARLTRSPTCDGRPDLVPAELADALAAHHTLEDALRWARAQNPALEVVAVVTQDEFTHDVVLADPKGRFLVYDTT